MSKYLLRRHYEVQGIINVQVLNFNEFIPAYRLIRTQNEGLSYIQWSTQCRHQPTKPVRSHSAVN